MNMDVKLMDVRRQMELDITEYEKATNRVLRGGQFILGEEVASFESEFATYIGVKHAIGVGNGTDALSIALQACGIGVGDEVITTPFTFFATVEAVASLGAVPVFVDIDEKSYDIDVSMVEERITDRTKAILPVHIYGNPCDMDAIEELSRKHNLKIIEDCAQSTGASLNGRQTGSFGDVGCFSFFPTKTLGCAGDGGMIVTNDDRVAEAARAIRVHGSGLPGLRTHNYLIEENKGNDIVYDKDRDIDLSMPKYYNFLIGQNSRLDAVQAALLQVKLKKLDGWTKRRNEIAERYRKELNGCGYIFQDVREDRRSAYYLFSVRHKESGRIKEYLKESGIGVGTYYPVPMHLEPALWYLGYKEGDFPVTEKLCRDVFSIPVWPEMTDEEVGYVIEKMREATR